MKSESYQSRNKNRPFGTFPLLAFCLIFISFSSMTYSDEQEAASRHDSTQLNWSDALQKTLITGKPSIIMITSHGLPGSEKWAMQLKTQLWEEFGSNLQVGELIAENEPQRVEALNVKSIPTVLIYFRSEDGKLKLGGYHEKQASLADLANDVRLHLPTNQASDNLQNASLSSQRPVRVRRVSTNVAVQESEPQNLADTSQNTPKTAIDPQVEATNHKSIAQTSPQNFSQPMPSKQIPQKTVPSNPTGMQSPPSQPQPVYAYVPQQPVYSAPPASPPVTIQPPAGQVIVQPSPLNVMVAPAPPPQVSYMTQPMATNAFAAPPAQPFTYAAPPVPTQALMAPPASPQPSGGVGYGFVMTNPNLLDRFIGGLGQIMAERGNPRIRMSRETPAMMSFPTGAGAPSPMQTYMAVPDQNGDAMEDYIKAYLKLCKEKGITPQLPGLDQPPVNMPTGPVPSPQDAPARKKWWFH